MSPHPAVQAVLDPSAQSTARQGLDQHSLPPRPESTATTTMARLNRNLRSTIRRSQHTDEDIELTTFPHTSINNPTLFRDATVRVQEQERRQQGFGARIQALRRRVDQVPLHIWTCLLPVLAGIIAGIVMIIYFWVGAETYK